MREVYICLSRTAQLLFSLDHPSTRDLNHRTRHRTRSRHRYWHDQEYQHRQHHENHQDNQQAQHRPEPAAPNSIAKPDYIYHTINVTIHLVEMCMLKRTMWLESPLKPDNSPLSRPFPEVSGDDPKITGGYKFLQQRMIRRPCEKAPYPKMCATITLEDTVIDVKVGKARIREPQTISWRLTPLADHVERLLKFQGNDKCTARYEQTVHDLMPDLLTEGWIHKEEKPFEPADVLDYLQYPADVEQCQANAQATGKGINYYEESLRE